MDHSFLALAFCLRPRSPNAELLSNDRLEGLLSESENAASLNIKAELLDFRVADVPELFSDGRR